MAADNEIRLISKAVRNRDISFLLDVGIKDDWFFVDENKRVWRFILQHWDKYGEVPTGVTVKDNFPGYNLLQVEDTMEYLVDQLLEYRKRQRTITVLQEATEAIDSGDHNSAIAAMSKAVSSFYDDDVRESRDIDLTYEPFTRYDEYLHVKTRPNGLLGMATGFNTIDKATSGLQPGQLITIIAPPKTGKSVLALQVAVNIHKDGAVPMFQSFEMTNLEQQHRHDAMRAHISYTRLTQGKLTPDEDAAYQESLRVMADMHKFYLTDAISALTVTGLSAKIDRLRPDVVFVDGAYVMIDEITGDSNTAQAITNITRNLKRLAMKKEIPIVITTQVLEWKMKKRRVTADAIGYSSSFFQDSDVILGLQRQDEEDDTSRELRIVASRNCGPASTDLLWDWEAGKFQEYGTFNHIPI